MLYLLGIDCKAKVRANYFQMTAFRFQNRQDILFVERINYLDILFVKHLPLMLPTIDLTHCDYESKLLSAKMHHYD